MTALSVQTAGALLILACYAIQLYTHDAHDQSKLNLANNFLGSAMVAVTSLGPRQWGIVLLEGTWAVIAVVFLIRAVVATRRAAERWQLPPTRGHSRVVRDRSPATTSLVRKGNRP